MSIQSILKRHVVERRIHQGRQGKNASVVVGAGRCPRPLRLGRPGPDGRDFDRVGANEIGRRPLPRRRWGSWPAASGRAFARVTPIRLSILSTSVFRTRSLSCWAAMNAASLTAHGMPCCVSSSFRALSRVVWTSSSESMCRAASSGTPGCGPSSFPRRPPQVPPETAPGRPPPASAAVAEARLVHRVVFLPFGGSRVGDGFRRRRNGAGRPLPDSGSGRASPFSRTCRRRSSSFCIASAFFGVVT